MQELEESVIKALPGTTLESLDNTDISTLFEFVEHLTNKGDPSNDVPDWYKPILEEYKQKEGEKIAR